MRRAREKERRMTTTRKRHSWIATGIGAFGGWADGWMDGSMGRGRLLSLGEEPEGIFERM